MAMTEIDGDPPVSNLDEEIAAPDSDAGEQDREMTLVEHLTELRQRLFICLTAIVVAAIVAFIFWEQILRFLLLPLPEQSNQILNGHQLLVTSPGGGFTIALLLSFAVGLVVATPVWLYQLWAFISPAMTRRERKYATPFTVIGVVLFLLGLAVGFITLRYPMEFLLSFGSGKTGTFVYLIQANEYFSFITFFLLAFGAAFELPLVITFMALIGLVSSAYLRKNRPYILFGLWVVSCFITPGADPYSPVILGVSFTVLYFFTEILIRIMGK